MSRATLWDYAGDLGQGVETQPALCSPRRVPWGGQVPLQRRCCFQLAQKVLYELGNPWL